MNQLITDADVQRAKDVAESMAASRPGAGWAPGFITREAADLLRRFVAAWEEGREALAEARRTARLFEHAYRHDSRPTVEAIQNVRIWGATDAD